MARGRLIIVCGTREQVDGWAATFQAPTVEEFAVFDPPTEPLPQ